MKTILFSSILIAYLAYKFNNIYVIENFEDPLRYKAFYSSVYIFSAVVRQTLVVINIYLTIPLICIFY